MGHHLNRGENLVNKLDHVDRNFTLYGLLTKLKSWMKGSVKAKENRTTELSLTCRRLLVLQSLEIHEGPGMPGLVPASVVLRGPPVELEDGGDHVTGQLLLLQLGTPVTQLQVAPVCVCVCVCVVCACKHR